MLDRFEVTEDDCIGCGLCAERAPENLEIRTHTCTARVFKQPQTPEQEQACIEARDYCPIDGIRTVAATSPRFNQDSNRRSRA